MTETGTTRITTMDELRRLYKPPVGRAISKSLGRLDPHCQRLVSLSPFCVLATARANGHADASPRGGPPGFVHCLDDTRLALPDARGNNRLDTLENILANDEVGLLFLVPGVDETLRVNGRAEIRIDGDLLKRFTENGKPPASVLVITVREAFLHCAKALMRSRLWDPDTRIERATLPSLGQMLRDQIGEGPAESQEEMVARYHETMR